MGLLNLLCWIIFTIWFLWLVTKICGSVYLNMFEDSVVHADFASVELLSRESSFAGEDDWSYVKVGHVTNTFSTRSETDYSPINLLCFEVTKTRVIPFVGKILEFEADKLSNGIAATIIKEKSANGKLYLIVWDGYMPWPCVFKPAK